MLYISTRDISEKKEKVTSEVAVCRGIAPDGGLYVPEYIPTLSADTLRSLLNDDYPSRAAYILSLFFDGLAYEELLSMCRTAYSNDRFPGGAAPLVHINGPMYSLELWHGPTCAFKDMALQIMPHLFTASLRETGEKRTAYILVATSGDTGKAALEGYRDVPGVRIKVFYPTNGVSRVQKLQMMTQEGDNVSVCAIDGNFDDAQSGVKRIFADADIKCRLNDKGYFLSSANSINWGRLAPQIAYYVSAYCDLVSGGVISMGDVADICVPTGNFGNILAAYIAKRMGVPIRRLICASNANNVLTDFIATGTYDRNRTFYTTMSPSMDILISSNLERLLYFAAGPTETAAYMKSLANTGRYTVIPETHAKIKSDFSGFYVDEPGTAATIKRICETSAYLVDPHTAVGIGGAEKHLHGQTSDESAPIIICSTASPFKFAADVYRSLTGRDPSDDVSALGELSELTGKQIPQPLSRTLTLPLRHTRVVPTKDMADEIFVGL